jgi:hypothetical protein
MRRWNRTKVAVLAVPLLVGCYSYAEIDRASVAPGATVRVALDRQEAVRQIDVLGGLRERVEGQVMEQSNGASLAMTVRQSATPSDGGRLNAFVTLPWTSVTLVEVKRFSLFRTGAVVGGGAVVAVAVLSVLEGGSKTGPGEGPGTNNAIRVPLIRVRW